MSYLPIDWLWRIGPYGIDINFRVWDIPAEEVVYTENGIGEIDLRDVLDCEVTWEDGEPFSVEDFLWECLLLDPRRVSEAEQA